MGFLQMSITAGFLVIVIVAIRAIALNKLPKTAFLILWGIALFRLLVPVAIPVQLSEISNNVMPQESTLIEAATWIMLPVSESLQNYANAPARSFSITSLLPIVWIVGAIACLFFFAVIYFKHHNYLRFAIPIRDNVFLNEWLSRHKIFRPLVIMQSDRITTPLAVGILRPRIILPKGMNMNDMQLLEHVLMHEYYHIRRFDALWKMLLVFAVCVHWFNPLVWVMFVMANREMELACDEMVLRHFGTETKTAYAYSIISMAEHQKSKFAPLHAGFNKKNKNATEERIVSIMKIKKTSIAGVALAIMLVTVLTIGAMTVFATNTYEVLERPADSVVSSGIVSSTGENGGRVTFRTAVEDDGSVIRSVASSTHDGETNNAIEMIEMDYEEFKAWSKARLEYYNENSYSDEQIQALQNHSEHAINYLRQGLRVMVGVDLAGNYVTMLHDGTSLSVSGRFSELVDGSSSEANGRYFEYGDYSIVGEHGMVMSEYIDGVRRVIELTMEEWYELNAE
ncbi:MAG: M56 family metallopeptidase [Defluviitaleaceae bacterium]|nr:M56 family metallopeptidase [Defluviitaleaceae bacterium]